MSTPASSAFEQAKAAFLAGLRCHESGDFEAAEGHYLRSLQLLPGRASTHVNLAATRLRLGRWADALASADAALAVEPDSPDALLHRGTALAELGRRDEALAALDRLIQRLPAHPLAWSHRGSLLREAGRHDEAAAAYREALRLGADPELHRYYLAGLGAVEAPASPPPGYVERLFDGYAGDFDAHLVGQLGYRAPEVLAALIREVRSDAGFASAIDLGCGTGLCGPLLRPLAKRLAGLDLSAAMLARSRALGVYDVLLQADAVAHLAATNERHDLVVAADMLIYVGDPAPLFAAVRRVLRAGGLFAFSAETCDDSGPGWRLLPSLRYAQSRSGLLRLARCHGLEPLHTEAGAVRHEQGRAVDGLYLVLSAPA